MQRYALTTSGSLCSVHRYHNSTSLVCPECRGHVEQRWTHEPYFYHRDPLSSCRWHACSYLHMEIQEYLWHAFAPRQRCIEHFFPALSCSADLALPSQRIAIEIVTYPYTPQQMLARTKAYWRHSWHVIWMLHTEHFGHCHASDLEEALQHIPHYFTHFSQDAPLFFDEISVAWQGIRRWHLPLARSFTCTWHPIIKGPPPSQYTKPSPMTPTAWYAARQRSWSCELPFHLQMPIPASSSLWTLLCRWCQRMRITAILVWLRLIEGNASNK